METLVKQRVSYRDFVAKAAKNRQGTVAWIIERYIVEMDGLDGKPAVKTLGLSHKYTLRRLQRSSIGAALTKDLSKSDVIAHCRERQAAGVLPQTVQQDGIKATYRDGILEIHVPKAEEAKPRQIAITVN